MRVVNTGAAREQFDFLLSAVLQDIRLSFRSDLSYFLCPKFPICLMNSLIAIPFVTCLFGKSKVCGLSCYFSRAPEHPIRGDMSSGRIVCPTPAHKPQNMRIRSCCVFSMQKIKTASSLSHASPDFQTPVGKITEHL